MVGKFKGPESCRMPEPVINGHLSAGSAHLTSADTKTQGLALAIAQLVAGLFSHIRLLFRRGSYDFSQERKLREYDIERSELSYPFGSQPKSRWEWRAILSGTQKQASQRRKGLSAMSKGTMINPFLLENILWQNEARVIKLCHFTGYFHFRGLYKFQ